MARSLVIGNGWPHKVFGHNFIMPFMLSYGDWGIIPLGRSEKQIPFVLRIGRFEFRILRPDHMGGSHRTISFHVQWMVYLPESVTYRMEEVDAFRKEHKSQREISFCWRWDMTVSYWKRGY